jgi:hypothetical protein
MRIEIRRGSDLLASGQAASWSDSGVLTVQVDEWDQSVEQDRRVGEREVAALAKRSRALVEAGRSVIAILDHGWIMVGVPESTDGTSITLTAASVVRSWSNGLGIGGLADPAHKADYTLDAVGRVACAAPIALIECDW